MRTSAAHQRRQPIEHLHLGRPTLRALALLLLAAGYPASEIADIVDCHARTIRRLVANFAEAGLDALVDAPRSGRPREGSLRLVERMAALLDTPRAWTVPRLRRVLRTGLSLSTVRRRVREVAQWRRPRLVATGDPYAPQRWASLRRAIARLPLGSVVMAEDECHLDLLPWIRSTCIRRGQRLEVMTPGQNRRRTLFGAIDITTSRWFC